MSKPVCRAITLYSFHIPIRKSNLEPQYTTIGFFDGMSTAEIDINYQDYDLEKLWEYTMNQTRDCDGTYSFQNIFVMSDDEWNIGCTDNTIWDENMDREYPLTMIVFLQLKEYLPDRDGIERQCKEFGSLAREHLDKGFAYVYSSIDKNDYVVCLKCRNYYNAVNTIKALHGIDKNVVYCYSIFSVSNAVLNEFSKDQYGYLFDEVIASICLKGITNSIRSENHTLKLDEKYWDFCEQLSEKLYEGEERREVVRIENGEKIYENKDRLYDILGDNDFRYIARDVNLGKLIREFAPQGMLSYSASNFPFYLFSSSLVLNTKTPDDYKKLESDLINDISKEMAAEISTKYCDAVSVMLEDNPDLDNIPKLIKNKYFGDDKASSIYYALYQLLQSFKVLEVSPAKRYDFFSMFPPFKMLVEIVQEKLEQGENIGDNNEMFDFIHKISMTFHSAQRTDIQFFQIPDFNVIIHYAPAKLRAFYAMWILNLAELYKSFKEKPNKNYSFIFAPGMFGITLVKQLFCGSEETRRLMLVTLPDRAMYNIKWLTIVLSHEAAHIGCERKRERRHESALKACARAAVLEIHAHILYGIQCIQGFLDDKLYIDQIRKTQSLLAELEERLMERNQIIMDQFGQEDRDDECRRKNSRKHIEAAFGKMRELYGEKIIADYCCHIKNTFIDSKKGEGNRGVYLTKISRVFNIWQDELTQLLELFQYYQLDKLAQIIYYIEEEAFSDLITILTLEHSMEDYIRSFTFGEITLNDVFGDKEGEKAGINRNKGTAGMVRMALVIDTFGKLVKHNTAIKYVPGLRDKWKEGQLKKLCKNLPKDSIERYISGQIACYTNGLRNISDNIGSYERMYDSVEQNFVKNTYDFLNDKVVWKAMSDYLYESAEGYLNKLTTSSDICERKRYIADVYQQLQCSSYLDVLQIVEDFLFKGEYDYIKYDSEPECTEHPEI